MRRLSINLCGIDEAGRGPLAGHLVVAGVILHSRIAGLNDSKKLTEKTRKSLFEKIIQHSTYHYVVWSANDIDTLGISHCIKSSLISIKSILLAEKYIFDGNSSFGTKGIETLIKADTQITEVMAASIIAKTIRDNLLLNEADRFPKFSFASHKGYGTAKHIKEIQEHGITELHRKSFCKKILENNTLF